VRPSAAAGRSSSSSTHHRVPGPFGGRPVARGLAGGRAARAVRGSRREKLSATLEKVTARLAADAPNMRHLGADLIAHYLDPDRLPVRAR